MPLSRLKFRVRVEVRIIRVRVRLTALKIEPLEQALAGCTYTLAFRTPIFLPCLGFVIGGEGGD